MTGQFKKAASVVRQFFGTGPAQEAGPVGRLTDIAPPISRQAERRRQIYAEVGEFLFKHDLDLTPLSFDLALSFVTGTDASVEQAVRVRLAEQGGISNADCEDIVQTCRPVDFSTHDLKDILVEAEANLNTLSEIAEQSTTSTQAYGNALSGEMGKIELDGAAVVAKLLSLTRDMI
ncbi:MAG: hypothetical protein ACKOUM_04275, partial [Sphingopyxis sp.]